MKPPFFRSFATLLFLFVVASGCATTGPHASLAAGDTAPDLKAEQLIVVAADNTPVAWESVVEQAGAADIVVLAEQHDDLLAHRYQAALTGVLAARGRVAVCMEMFERDEQALVDAYLAGSISQKTLVDITDSKDWGAKGAWDEFYQPIVDAAKEGRSPVIAANAPRRFTRLGRLESFESLATFAEAYPEQFVVPAPIEQSAYYERFKATMSHHSAPPAKGKKGDAHAMPALTEDQFEGMFRAQQVWDATMADSVVKAWRAHGKAMLMVGQFHTDHEGGLLLRLRAAAPEAKILTISLDKAESNTLREGDYGRADLVVYRPASGK